MGAFPFSKHPLPVESGPEEGPGPRVSSLRCVRSCWASSVSSWRRAPHQEGSAQEAEAGAEQEAQGKAGLGFELGRALDQGSPGEAEPGEMGRWLLLSLREGPSRPPAPLSLITSVPPDTVWGPGSAPSPADTAPWVPATVRGPGSGTSETGERGAEMETEKREHERQSMR